MRGSHAPVICRLTTAMSLVTLVAALHVARAFGDVDWSDPESIDIYRVDAGDFLETDQYFLASEARDAYESADYEKAARYYMACLRCDISDGSSIYNLACCYGLLGRERLAALYLLRAFRAGFDDLDWVNSDPDFDPVRATPLFASLVDSLETARAEADEGAGRLSHFEGRVLLPCRLQLPEGFTGEEQDITLIVGLHGYGSNEVSFASLYERFATRDFILAAPRAPYAFAMGSYLGFSWGTWDEDDPSVGERAGEGAEEYVLDLVDALRQSYDIGEVYLMGFSQGCGFTYGIGLLNPEYFDGLICLAGRLDTSWVSVEQMRSIGDLRIFIGHGYDDRAITYDASEEAYRLLDEAGVDVTLFGYSAGHSVPEEVVQEAERWMRED